MTNAVASELTQRTCVFCEGAVEPLAKSAVEMLTRQLAGGWEVKEGHYLEKEFVFKDFAQALRFTNAVGAIAEEEGHHPDVFLSWGRVRLQVWTHKINGLTESDFVFAAKVDQACADR